MYARHRTVQPSAYQPRPQNRYNSVLLHKNTAPKRVAYKEPTRTPISSTTRLPTSIGKSSSIFHSKLPGISLFFRCYASPSKSKNEPAKAIGTEATSSTVYPSHSVKELIGIYASLAKFRLSSLVIFSTMIGYYMAPIPVLELDTFVWSSVGTSLAIASANTFNQYIEIEHDAKMSRTLKRMLPMRVVSPNHALAFGFTTGTLGCTMLLSQVNALSAVLALSNIILYTCVYTPLKRYHPINTWIGSFVGAIPPMIGWAAATGGLEPGAWVLAAILYIWQLPHFLSLAWGLRHDYAKGGYRMLSNVAPDKLPGVTLRWSLAMLPLGYLCTATGLTTAYFTYDSLLVDAYLIYYAFIFWNNYRRHKNHQQQSNHNSNTDATSTSTANASSTESSTQQQQEPLVPDTTASDARKLFHATLYFLPLFLLLMVLHRDSSSVSAQEDDEDNEDKESEPRVVAIDEEEPLTTTTETQ